MTPALPHVVRPPSATVSAPDKSGTSEDAQARGASPVPRAPASVSPSFQCIECAGKTHGGVSTLCGSGRVDTIELGGFPAATLDEPHSRALGGLMSAPPRAPVTVRPKASSNVTAARHGRRMLLAGEPRIAARLIDTTTTGPGVAYAIEASLTWFFTRSQLEGHTEVTRKGRYTQHLGSGKRL